MDDRARVLISKSYLYGVVPAVEFSEWAVEMLTDGKDSKDLRMLAATFDEESFYEINERFRKCLDEFGWEYPSKDDCLDWYINCTIARIAEGAIEPFEGCSELKAVCSAQDYPRHLNNWLSLYWATDEVPENELSEMIVAEAKRITAGEPSKYIDGFDYIPERKAGSFASRLWKKYFG